MKLLYEFTVIVPAIKRGVSRTEWSLIVFCKFYKIVNTLIFAAMLFSGASFAINLNKLTLPKGFKVEIFADKIIDARSMVRGDHGTIFVGTDDVDRVYAVVPNKDGTRAEKVYVIADGLEMPNGVAYFNSDLYVVENHRIIKFKNIEDHLAAPPKPVVVRNDLPTEKHHGWRYAKFGPDGMLYIAIGAPCNVCLSKDQRFATIVRMKPDGSNFEVFASGVRNSVGFDWDPKSHELWFTDNGRDWLGDNRPPDELNHAPKKGLFFGFPFIHGDGIKDPEFGESKQIPVWTRPVQELGAHVAALGMHFYRGTQFPDEYCNQIFIAEHGSWNRSEKSGYRVSLVKINADKAVAYQPFITGWLRRERHWGRPVDILEMPDGALLISDDYAGVIYRVSYHGAKK